MDLSVTAACSFKAMYYIREVTMYVQSTIAAPGASIVEDAACNWHMEVVCVRRFAAVPVSLVLLPSRMQVTFLGLMTACTVSPCIEPLFQINITSASWPGFDDGH